MLFLLGVRFRAPARARPRATGSARPGCGLQAASSGSTPANASTSENGGNHSAIRIQPAERPRHRRPRAGGAPRDRTFEPHLQSSLPPRHCAGGATPPHAPPARPSRRPRGRAAAACQGRTGADARWLRGASLGRLGGPRLCVCVDRGAGSAAVHARRPRGSGFLFPTRTCLR